MITERRLPSSSLVLSVASFGAFLAFLDATIVNVAFPSIQLSFPHTSLANLSWVLNGYNIVFAGMLVVSGRVADLVGRRRVFVTGLVIFTVASGACAAANSVGLLVALRVLQGCGGAMLVPSSVGIVVEAVTAERRTHAIGLWSAAGALAAGLGPPIGGALVQLANWRLCFLVNVPMGIIGLWLVRRTVIESRAPGVRRIPDLLGAVALSLALGAVTLGLVQGGTWGWWSPSTIGAFVFAVLATVLVVRRSATHRSPIIDPRLLRIRSFSVGNLIVVASGLGLYTYLLTHILWLHYVWNYTLLDAGLAVAPGAIIAAAVARPFGRLADRVGPRPVVFAGALCWAGAFLWYSTRIGLRPDFLGQWLPGQVLSGIGVGATLPVASSASLASVPAGRYATAAAVTNSARQLGGVLGIAILTIFIGHSVGLSLPAALRHGWELAGGSFAVAAVLALAFGRVRAKESAADEDSTGAPIVLRAAEAVVTSVPTIADIDLLAMLPAEARERVLAGAQPVHLLAGDPLFSAGDPGESMYLLRAGRLEVRLPNGRVGVVRPGSTVGELALLTGSARSATIVAHRDSSLLEINRQHYDDVSAAYPEVPAAIATVLARQLQMRNPPVLPPQLPAVVTVVAIDEHVAISSLAYDIYRELSETLRVVCPPGEITPEEMVRAEADNDRVLLVAGSSGPWRDLCLRQADHVIIAAVDPEPTYVAGLSAGADIVLCGPAPSRQQLLGWYPATACRRVYHVGQDEETWSEGVRPIVDRLLGRSVGLALAGGGARALAHIGVLAAFADAGVPVDRVSGSSMAALIAGLHATGAGTAEIDALVFEEFVRGNPFGDYTLPLTSLSRGRRGEAMLERCFGDRHIEELPRELIIATTDLQERTPVYHTSGLLRDVVAASICLPVLFAPRSLGGRTLVDGSLTDSCPTAPLVAQCEGPVIAVRIGSSAASDAAADESPDPADPRDGRAPSIGETLVRVMMMGERSAGDDGVAVSVRPDTRAIGLLEFHQIDEAIEAGRRAGEAAVEALRQTGWQGSSPPAPADEQVPVAANDALVSD